MSKSQSVPPALFKAAVDSAALKLGEQHPTGFNIADVAALIDCGPITKALRRSIRQRLATLCKAERLSLPDAGGIYLPTGKATAAMHLATDPVLLDDVRRVFFDAGGFIQMPEIVAALGLDDAGAEKRVRAVISECPLFERFTPIKGMRKHWRLSDSERVTVPVPGRWLLADLQLKVLRMGGGKIPWSWGLNEALELQRVRIGNGLRDARKLWRLTPEEMVADAGISSALDACLSRATGLQYQDPKIVGLSDDKVSEWWGDVKAGFGQADALVEAWLMLEGNDGHPYLLDALDVASWVAIGAKTKLDPALLSRGAIDFDWRTRFACESQDTFSGTLYWP